MRQRAAKVRRSRAQQKRSDMAHVAGLLLLHPAHDRTSRLDESWCPSGIQRPVIRAIADCRSRSGHTESIIPTVFPKSFTRLCLLPATEPRRGTPDGAEARNTGRIRPTVTSLPGSGIRARSIGIAVGNAKALRLLFAFLCLHRWAQGFAKPKTQRKPNHRKALPDWGVDYAHWRFHPFGCTQRPIFSL